MSGATGAVDRVDHGPSGFGQYGAGGTQVLDGMPEQPGLRDLDVVRTPIGEDGIVEEPGGIFSTGFERGERGETQPTEKRLERVTHGCDRTVGRQGGAAL